MSLLDKKNLIKITKNSRLFAFSHWIQMCQCNCVNKTWVIICISIMRASHLYSSVSIVGFEQVNIIWYKFCNEFSKPPNTFDTNLLHHSFAPPLVCLDFFFVLLAAPSSKTLLYSSSMNIGFIVLSKLKAFHYICFHDV